MNSSIGYSFIPEIKDRINIVEVIAETIDLKRKGNSYWGLCPFHQEKTPSFCVNSERQTYYCFGCHCTGDVIQFVQEYYHLSFIDACNWLAERYGIHAYNQTNKDFEKRVEEKQQFKKREKLARTIIEEEYTRLCRLEKACYRIIATINDVSDLERDEVIEALKAKDKLAYWLTSFLDGDETNKLEIAVMLRGVEI